MKILHLTIMIFCQVLLASFILYSTVTSALPISESQSLPVTRHQEHVADQIKLSPNSVVAESKKPVDSLARVEATAAPAKEELLLPRSAPLVPAPVAPVSVPAAVESKVHAASEPIVAPEQVAKSAEKPVDMLTPRSSENVAVPKSSLPDSQLVQKSSSVVEPAVSSPVVAQPVAPVAVIPAVASPAQPPASPVAPLAAASQGLAPVAAPEKVLVVEPRMEKVIEKVAQHQEESIKSAAEIKPIEASQKEAVVMAKSSPIVEAPISQAQVAAPVVTPLVAPVVAPIAAPVAVSAPVPAPVVKGGLGPLHLLAATLCSYQPERPVADETLNLLYSQRAALRKSLFDFMSLKFTNLEKLSSRLNPGFSSLEVVPQKTTSESSGASGSSVAPSHGWPVVGKCTAHDLKLMAEAAWCETSASPVSAPVLSQQQQQASVAPLNQASSQVSPASSSLSINHLISNQVDALDKEEPRVSSNQHLRARSLDPAVVANEQASSVISKMLHVNDVKDAPIIDGSLVNSLNATQRQQLASAIQQVAPRSTRECRRTALRLTKSLFNHLAEDQKDASESWPLLYSQMAEDECARKRMIDIVTALSNFRGDATGSIRRDNVEYAFAMDDLRAKVLENEVNVPLTFDKQFIEVEQFLQQSVKLMLANIDPERARLTSMRYRSLMPGPLAADDQCIELHQRLLAKNYPTDCNPAQFGQLPDVLRMAANSLALWSVETELSKHSSKIVQDYPLLGASSSSVAGSSPALPSGILQPAKQDINDCIANLVSS